VFANTLYTQVAATAPEIDPIKISEAGASGLRSTFSGKDLTLLIDAYMAGIKSVFTFAVAGSVATVLVAFMIPPTRLPAPEKEAKEDQEEGANASKDD
jgi:hypothetical protein